MSPLLLCLLLFRILLVLLHVAVVGVHHLLALFGCDVVEHVSEGILHVIILD